MNAITWLNESSPASFYLLKVEAVRIGDSPPAPLLTAIVGPSEESREIGKTKKEWAERDKLRYQFWSELLERARARTSLHANISPNRGNWVGTGAGKAGLGYNYAIRQHDAQAELYIDRGKEAGDENKAIFDQLHARKEEIEQAFGGRLNWGRLDGRRACRISKQILAGGYRDADWSQSSRRPST